MKGRDGIARAIYVTAMDRRSTVLHVFRKKTRKDAARDDPDRLVRIERVGTMTISYTELRKSVE